ncbi:hypothetical protein VKT23_015198 [Stygiomarasmius scandens]|uniref:Uncharacterized protein n=1 Tax=Marasmiellus scandens TaxID=2682957 RepID=A0ABR1J2T9_9AGAR
MGLSHLMSSSPQSLQSVTLDLFICLHSVWPAPFADIRALPEWTALDDFLSSSGSLANFIEFNVRLSVDVDISFLRITHAGGDSTKFIQMNLSQEVAEGAIREEFVRVFESCLPATNHSGKLRIEFRTILMDSFLERFSLWNEGRPKTNSLAYAFET